MTELSTSRRPAILIVVIALAWLVAAGTITVASGVDPTSLAAGALARYAGALILRLAPPLAVILVGVELLRRRGDTAAIVELEERTAAAAAAGQGVRDGLFDIDATLATIAGRLEALRATTLDQLPQLADGVRQLEAGTAALTNAGFATAASAREVGDALPAAKRQADALAATLAKTGSESARQLGEVETMLAGVLVRQHEALAQVTSIDVASTAAAATLEDRVAALTGAVDGALDRTAGALDAVRDGVEAQSRAMLASIDAARTGLDAIGGPAAATVAARIDHIAASTAALGASLADHDAQTGALVVTMERSFAVLEKRLGHAAAMGTATLDDWHGRMGAVRDLADAVNPPLDAATLRLAAVEAAAVRIGPLTTTADDLTRALAKTTAPAAALAADLAAARAELSAIEEAAHGSALAAATQLIDALGRVRGIADASAAGLREALAAVVAEAKTALADAGARTAATAFADPIRREIAGLEGAAALAGDAAQATADRIAARLLGLTATVATVERRLAEVER